MSIWYEGLGSAAYHRPRRAISMLLFIILVVLSAQVQVHGLTSPPKRVLVTGAGSSVGLEVFKKLLKAPTKFVPHGLVRTAKDAQVLIKLGARAEQICIGDITDRSSIKGLFDGIDKCVLCTTARPKKSTMFRIKQFFRSLVGKKRAPRVEELSYTRGYSPYEVDFLGQKNVIDLAVESGTVQHIVLLSNMGGYSNSSRLNDIGKKDGDPNSGNLLKWKRAAERYLIKRSFFTILHAGTLTDDPGGRREIIWDVDDNLMRNNFKKIPKADVAEVIVQSLLWKEAIGRSIDIAARGEGTGPTKDWLRFFALPGNNLYPSDLSEQ